MLENGISKKRGPGSGWFGFRLDPCMKMNCYLGVPLESGTTGTQTTNLPLIESKALKEKTKKTCRRMHPGTENDHILHCYRFYKTYLMCTSKTVNGSQPWANVAYGSWSFTFWKMVSSQLRIKCASRSAQSSRSLMLTTRWFNQSVTFKNPRSGRRSPFQPLSSGHFNSTIAKRITSRLARWVCWFRQQKSIQEVMKL